MDRSYDFVVIGGGVVGASTAFHLASLGDVSVAVVDRGEMCSGGTAKSCAIIRSHYTVPSNTALTVRSLEMFRDFREALGHDDVDCGFTNSGYLILAGEGPFADSLSDNLAMQAGVGAQTYAIDHDEASRLHPLLDLGDIAAIGYEPESGYADPIATTQGLLTAATRAGVDLLPHTAVEGFRTSGENPTTVTAVETSQGTLHAGHVISAVGPWTGDLFAQGRQDDGLPSGPDPLRLEVSRHVVLTFAAQDIYDPQLPVTKDLTVDNKMYFRPTRDGVVLAGTGDHGDPVTSADAMDPDADPGLIALQREQLAARMPSFQDSDLTAAWIGPYDITPDWNPVVGGLPGVDGLTVTYGFSGHGFKLAPALGRSLAQGLLSRAPDVDLTPYRFERFAEDDLLIGAYGVGSIS